MYATLHSTAMNVKIIDRVPFGPVALVWTEGGGGCPMLVQALLSTQARPAVQRVADLHPGAARASCREIDNVASRIAAFLNGNHVTFSLNALAFDTCGAFHRRVLRATHSIPWGHVATYGGIAINLDRPGGARAVGNAMATNPFPLIIPCHRVIRSDLTLGAYGGGAAMKRHLLEQEGIVFEGRGRAPETRVVFRS